MYLNCRIEIPKTEGKISIKTINGTPYVYYEYGRVYLKDKKYNTPKRTCIGMPPRHIPEKNQRSSKSSAWKT